MSLRSLFTRACWYERVGVTPACNKPALVMLTGARYTSPALAVDYLETGTDHLTVRLGSGDRRQREEFAEDLEAADVAATWFPVRRSDPALEALRQPERIARSLNALAEASATNTAQGPSLEVIVERMGQAAADVTPQTDASRRTRAALAALYDRLTGDRASFLSENRCRWGG